MMLEDTADYWRRVFTFSPFTVCSTEGPARMILPLGMSESGLPMATQLVGRSATSRRCSAWPAARGCAAVFERKPALVTGASR